MWFSLEGYQMGLVLLLYIFAEESGCQIQKSLSGVIHENKITLFVASVLLVSPRSQLVRVEVCHTPKAI